MTVRDSLKTAAPYLVMILGMGAMFLVGTHWDKSPDPSPAPVPSISLPENVKVPVGKGAVRIDVSTRSKSSHVRWIVYPADEGRLQVIPYPDHAQVIAIAGGTYYLGADLATSDGDVIWCRISTDEPKPPGPVPPDPEPPLPKPDPKPPVPVPPAPIGTPLTKTLQAAYDSDLDPKKAEDVAGLIEVLDSAVTAAKNEQAKTVRDYQGTTKLAPEAIVAKYGKVKTAKDFQIFVKTATDLRIGEKALSKVRPAVGAYLASVLPTAPSTPANDAYWTKAASEYGYVALSLKGVVK